jgi:Protein of unknown function (DUF2914)
MATDLLQLQRLRKYQNPIIFVGGFIFDSLTVKRIDSLVDILFEVAYMSALTILLVFQYREHHELWTPGKFIGRVWHYNIEALHFIYGGLLSVNVVLYFKSSSGAKPIVFFLFLVALLFINEMPQIKKYGYRLRLGLYAFCMSTLLIYLIPILLGIMGDFIFLLSMAVSAWLVWLVAGRLTAVVDDSATERKRLYVPAAGVIVIIIGLYFMRLIPPVPLSVKAQGIYHDIQKIEGKYVLRTARHPFYMFWRKDSRPFIYRKGDQLNYFVSIFAPSRFKHTVMIHWEILDEKSNSYLTSDRIPLQISGGRAEGFRGVATKTNFNPGRWRVSVETEDGRTIGRLSFDIKLDENLDERLWDGTVM